MKIVFEPFGLQYRVYLKQIPEIKAYGRNRVEAYGRLMVLLIRRFGQSLNIIIEDKTEQATSEVN